MHHVAVVQVNLPRAVHHLAHAELHVLPLAVLQSLYLHVVHEGVVLQAAGILDQFPDALTLGQLVPHRAVHRAGHPNQLLGHGHEQHVAVLKVVGYRGIGLRHVGIQVKATVRAAAAQLYVAHRADGRRPPGGGKGVERGVKGRQGEAALYAHLAVDAHNHRAGRRNGDGYLVLAEQVVARKAGADGRAGLGDRQALEEYLGGTRRLDGTVGVDTLVDLGLGGAEDGDVHLVALAQYVGVGGLGTVSRAEHVHRRAGEQGVPVDVVPGGRGHVVLLQGLLEGCLGGGLAGSGLGGILGGGHDLGPAGGGSCGGDLGNGLGRGLLGLHLLDDLHHPALVLGIVGGGNGIHVYAVLQQAGLHLGHRQAALLELGLAHGHDGGLGLGKKY